MKSLDKKKGIKDFSGHNYFENDYDKKKELSNCCNAGVTINSGGEGTRYYICDECGNPCDLKSWHEPVEDKSTKKHPTSKTKELDWDTLGIKDIFSQWLFFNGKLTGKEAEELWNKLSLIFKATLTQQRTELLEEIKTRIDTWGGFEDDGGNLCHYDSEILEWVNDLLNKKDE